MPLALRSANSYRKGGDWNADDFDVLDGDQVVGRVYRVNSPDELWFWGVSFHLTNRKSYGHAASFNEARGHSGRNIWRGRERLGDAPSSLPRLSP